jgi:hypothetical protein
MNGVLQLFTFDLFYSAIHFMYIRSFVILFLLTSCETETSPTDALQQEINSLGRQKNELEKEKRRYTDSMESVKKLYNGNTEFLYDTTYSRYEIENAVIVDRIKSIDREMQEAKERLQFEKK